MRRSFHILPVILLSAILFAETVYGYSPSSPANGSAEKSKKEVRLFNGRNLEGWYTFIRDRGRNSDPKGVFTVQKRMIRISGEEYGCITTNEEFENYTLTVEFKWGEVTFAPRTDKARDSGILLHSVGKDGGSGGVWMHSIECQMIEGGTGDFIVVGDGTDQFYVTSPVAAEKQGGSHLFQPDGELVTINKGRINWFGRDPGWKDVKGFRGSQDVEKPVGKWNKLVCVVKGKEIQIYLNNTLVNHAVDVKPSKGKIQIQSEGAELFIRKVSLVSF